MIARTLQYKIVSFCTNPRDMSFAVAMLAVNGLIWLELRKPQYREEHAQDYGFDPVFFPRILLVLWGVLAGMLFVRALLKKAKTTESPIWVRFFTVVALTFSYLLAVKQIGFLFASIPFCGIFMYVFGYRHKIIMPLIAFVFPAVTWWVFVYLLHIPLPDSPWFTRL